MDKKSTSEELNQRVRDLEKEIDARKQAEELLRESEARYRLISENTNDIIWTTDMKLRLTYLSPSVNRLGGGVDEKFMSGTLADFLTPASLEAAIKLYKEELANEKELASKNLQTKDLQRSRAIELEYKRQDGTTFWTEAVMDFIRDEHGKPVGILGVTRDINKRKQAENALRESEEKYRTILENIEEGYYELDLAGNLTFFSDSLCKILGYPRDDLLGMNYRKYMDAENAQKANQVANNIYNVEQQSRLLNFTIIKGDGIKRDIESSSSLMKDAEGQSIGFRGLMRDITERKRLEEERKKLEAQVQYAQRIESIGTLAGGLAHNFNNLLMAIQGNASMALLDIDADHPQYQNLKKIEKQVTRGAKLTKQILGYAREGRYEVKPTNLNQLLRETSNAFGEARKEIRVHQELADDLFGTTVDQGQIEQVLLTLYVNAADAMPGGGDLFLKTKNVTHNEICGKSYEPKKGNYVLLSVRDTGIGMDAKTMDRIFEPFFTTKGFALGTGLGLASTYGIIKAHGGYIDVDSEMGSGTTFSIFLPATEQAIEAEKDLPGELLEGKGTVLLVDDEEMVLDAGGRMLKRLGYDVLSAKGGQEALELYEKNQNGIDMILLDMIMPDMGGGKTFDRLKGINPKVKVLLSSGYDIDGEAKEILERGCDAFIQKPFNIEQLSQKVMKVMHKR
jgi:PAS domain S-box-containing protein